MRIFIAITLLMTCYGSFQAQYREYGYGSILSEQNEVIRNDPLNIKTNRIDSKCYVSIDLVDTETNKFMPGMIKVIDTNQQALSIHSLLCRGVGLNKSHPGKNWYVITDSSTNISIPQTKGVIQAFHGINTEISSYKFDFVGKDSSKVTIPLKTFYEPKLKNWYSGNTHLHLMNLTSKDADEYLNSIPMADGLELVFLSYLERTGADASYISNKYKPEELNSLSNQNTIWGFGEEHRHNLGANSEGYGHVMILNTKKLYEPVSIGPGIMGTGYDYPNLRKVIKASREDKTNTIWCHNAFGMEYIPSWLDNSLDAHNIFDGGSVGDYEDTFYKLLNIGLHIPFSTGTDWFIYDYSRVYVKLDNKLDAQNWLNGLSEGKSFITNGVFLELNANSKEIGETIEMNSPTQIDIIGSAFCRNDFEKIELIHNGTVIKTYTSKKEYGHYKSEFNYGLNIDRPGWIALRIESNIKNEMGHVLFGHTSPIYIEYTGDNIFEEKSALALINDLESNILKIKDKAIFANGQQRNEILDLYSDAINKLNEMINKNKI